MLSIITSGKEISEAFFSGDYEKYARLVAEEYERSRRAIMESVSKKVKKNPNDWDLRNHLDQAEILLACVLHDLKVEDCECALSPNTQDGIEQYTSDYEIDWEKKYEEFASSVGLI